VAPAATFGVGVYVDYWLTDPGGCILDGCDFDSVMLSSYVRVDQASSFKFSGVTVCSDGRSNIAQSAIDVLDAGARPDWSHVAAAWETV
jgi:hypothetical protein